MSEPGEQPTDGFLQPEDLSVLESLEGGSQWLRAVLCTLARRGIAFRREHPERTQRILDVLSTSPLYKSGQFLFDLLELEDFMVDGAPAETISTTFDATTLTRLALFLNSVRRHLDGAVEPLVPAGLDIQLPPSPSGTTTAERLPPLQAGFYLYQDVVLGFVRSLQIQLNAKTEERGIEGGP